MLSKYVVAAALAIPILATGERAMALDPKTLEGSGANYGLDDGPDQAAIDTGPDANAAQYTTNSLTNMSSDQLDALYVRLTSGPIPDGFFNGSVMIPPDRGLQVVKPLLGGTAATALIKKLSESLWSGKYFDRQRRLLQNRVNPDAQVAGVAKIPTKVNDKNMAFPAKVYCGQSLYDSRRESIVIDYKYGEADWPADLAPDDAQTAAERAELNWLTGPKGLLVRDEIRMVKPGLYLGRAYLQGVFGLYFVLQYASESGGQSPETLVKEVGDECWIGHQRQLQLNKKQSDYVNN